MTDNYYEPASQVAKAKPPKSTCKICGKHVRAVGNVRDGHGIYHGPPYFFASTPSEYCHYRCDAEADRRDKKKSDARCAIPELAAKIADDVACTGTRVIRDGVDLVAAYLKAKEEAK